MKNKKPFSVLLIAIFILVCTLWSFGTADWKTSMIKAYPNLSKSNLTACITCHIEKIPKKGKNDALNVYGADLAKAAKTNKTTVWTATAKLDSDKDGLSNDAELKKGTNPSDPKSK